MGSDRNLLISGDARFDSAMFSNEWQLRQDNHVVARVRRVSRTYVSTAELDDYGTLLLEPVGLGTVHAINETGAEIGRIVRRSWMGRHWELDGNGFSYELHSDHRPRRWHLSIANADVANLWGSLASYNHVHLHSAIPVPVPALLLAWHVIARPWEAANEPRHLVPNRATPDGHPPPMPA